jgi:hypothetical protein
MLLLIKGTKAPIGGVLVGGGGQREVKGAENWRGENSALYLIYLQKTLYRAAELVVDDSWSAPSMTVQTANQV